MPLEETIQKLQQSISLLDKRIEKLENLVLSESMERSPCEPFAQESILEEAKINFEGFSGASQLGWLGIVISIICCFFFIYYSFQQNWVTGLGQTLVLAILGLVLFVASDTILKKHYRKFGMALALASSLFFFMAIYWSGAKDPLTSHRFLISASLVLWVGALFWGVIRKSPLWPTLGTAGACLLPVFVIQDFVGSEEPALYYLIVMIVSFALALLKNWSLLGFVTSLLTHVFLFLFIREANFTPQILSTNSLLGMVLVFPAVFILWSGLVALVHGRPTTTSEKFSWSINNIIIYSYLFAFWCQFQKPWLLLIPVSVNAVLYFTSRFKNRKQSHAFFYLLGTVIATAIALTVLMPVPLDIISLCLFAVYLGYKGDKEEGWHLKTVSGAVIVWSLIFLFFMRFHFTSLDEIPFFNLRFSSFVIAFFCFGYQGRMINDDFKAREMGPLLGQGLLSLGLIVLLLGMGGEVMHLFPSADKEQVSQLALLFLTILVGLFAFAVTYAGVVLKLFFIRILAIVFFFLLISKLLFFDLFRLDLLYLVISLGCVGLLLGCTSVLLKKKNHAATQPFRV